MSNTAVLATGATLLAASLGLAYMTMNAAGNTQSASRELVDIEDEDCITEDDVVEVFDKIFLEVQNRFTQVMTQIQAYQMRGQSIPEAQLQMLIKGEMEGVIVAKQPALVESKGMDMDCFQEATWEFMETSPKVIKCVERLQKLWQNATGEPVVGWRPGKSVQKTVEPLLSPEKTIEAAEVYFSSLTVLMKSVITQYKADGKDLQNPAVQQALNTEFARASSDRSEEALEQMGVSLSQFEESVKSHQNNPDVARALAMINMRHQQELGSLQ